MPENIPMLVIPKDPIKSNFNRLCEIPDILSVIAPFLSLEGRESLFFLNKALQNIFENKLSELYTQFRQQTVLRALNLASLSDICICVYEHTATQIHILKKYSPQSSESNILSSLSKVGCERERQILQFLQMVNRDVSASEEILSTASIKRARIFYYYGQKLSIMMFVTFQCVYLFASFGNIYNNGGMTAFTWITCVLMALLTVGVGLFMCYQYQGSSLEQANYVAAIRHNVAGKDHIFFRTSNRPGSDRGEIYIPKKALSFFQSEKPVDTGVVVPVPVNGAAREPGANGLSTNDQSSAEIHDVSNDESLTETRFLLLNAK